MPDATLAQLDNIVCYPLADIAMEVSSHRAIAFQDIQLVLRLVLHVCQTGVPGDIIELGCAHGTTTLGIRKVMNLAKSDKKLHVCDSFKGLPKPTEEDWEPEVGSKTFHEGVFSIPQSDILNNFATADLEPPIIHRGWFAEIQDYPDVLAFAFVDGDLYQSIWDGLTAVYPRMSPGGIIVVHDYRYPPLPGAKKACDAFFAAKPEPVTPRADSAVIVKGQP